MKKLIITESQYIYLKQHIDEAGDKESKMRDFLTEIKKSFLNTLASSKIGNFVTFDFCNISEDGTWDKSTLSMITFKLIEKDNYTIKLEFVTSEGKETPINSYGKGSNFVLHPNDGDLFALKNNIPIVEFAFISKDGNKSSILHIPNFTSFIITDKKVRTNSIKASEEAHNKWMEANQKFNNSMNYEPGYLGMDNFFFFPKGYLAMDDTLKKFGLSVKDDSGFDISVRVKEETGIEVYGEKLAFNTIYKGFLSNGKIVIHGKDVDFIFYIGNQKIGTGGDFIFNTSYKDRDGNIHPIERNDSKSKLNIVKMDANAGE
jgi:hypothetical protein